MAVKSSLSLVFVIKIYDLPKIFKKHLDSGVHMHVPKS